jgi:hypothetical protein
MSADSHPGKHAGSNAPAFASTPVDPAASPHAVQPGVDPWHEHLASLLAIRDFAVTRADAGLMEHLCRRLTYFLAASPDGAADLARLANVAINELEQARPAIEMRRDPLAAPFHLRSAFRDARRVP